jgi:hypothetical protein
MRYETPEERFHQKTKEDLRDLINHSAALTGADIPPYLRYYPNSIGFLIVDLASRDYSPLEPETYLSLLRNFFIPKYPVEKISFFRISLSNNQVEFQIVLKKISWESFYNLKENHALFEE